MSPARKGLILPGLAALLAFIALVLLGFWQIERMGAKHRLMARVEQSLASAPAPLAPESAWATLKPKSFDFSRVTVSGRFLHDKEAHLYTVLAVGERGDTEVGYSVLTPLVLDTGAIVIINRGFVPSALKESLARKDGLIDGAVTVSGIMRAPEIPGYFVPNNDIAHNMWFSRDPVMIGKAAHLERVAPFVIDADATPVPGGWPSGGHTVVSFTDNHLQYALTWFALALVLATVFTIWARRRWLGQDA